MKIQKSKTLLLSLLLAMSLNVAHAQSLNDVFNGIKNKISEGAKAATDAAKEAAKNAQDAKDARDAKDSSDSRVTDDKSVDNSLLDFGGSISPEVKWVMIVIKKNNFKEQLTFAANNGLYQARVPLQDGAGVYDIELYANRNTDRYTSYTQFKRFTVENTDSRDMSFLLPTFKAQSDDSRIKDLVASLTKDAQNDEEAFLAIYKYITSTIKYDHASLNNRSYVNKDYNAINTLVNSTAVCEGYANLVAAMSRAYGIRTKVVFGQAKIATGYAAHGWNEVLINDEWKYVDATWDAGRKKQPYLFMDGELFSREHIKEKEMNY